mmetsp:Transcript_70926/g.184932  ORF Transcript_70926/g.184932 Transcript_70926/m.184932 type:complete len:227 (-) Transcript_70926:292-972(-)
MHDAGDAPRDPLADGEPGGPLSVLRGGDDAAPAAGRRVRPARGSEVRRGEPSRGEGPRILHREHIHKRGDHTVRGLHIGVPQLQGRGPHGGALPRPLSGGQRRARRGRPASPRRPPGRPGVASPRVCAARLPHGRTEALQAGGLCPGAEQRALGPPAGVARDPRPRQRPLPGVAGTLRGPAAGPARRRRAQQHCPGGGALSLGACPASPRGTPSRCSACSRGACQC